MPFETEDRQEIYILTQILVVLRNQVDLQNKILEHIMGTTPVTQAQFDTALSTLNTTLSSLLTALTSIGQGLTNLENALSQAQAGGSVDLSGELATVQNMQAEISQAVSTANAELASIPTAEQPTSPTISSVEKTEPVK